MELVGRDAEVAAVRERFAAGRRLVTVVGPGGIGKTALARQVLGGPGSARTRPLVVELGRIDRTDGVRDAIVGQLGFASFDVLVDAPELAGAVMLVDNCEHVIDAAAEAVEALLDLCVGVAVLATSRSPLGLPGESVVSLTPLAVPVAGAIDASCDSVRLFRERAADAGVVVADTDVDLVGEICRRVDGVPLAIELAAARLRTLSFTDLIAGLAEGVDLLERHGGRRIGRQRSVRETTEWSMSLLGDDDRLALERLAVCPGWLDAGLVASLAGLSSLAGASLIDRLVDASLLVVDRRATPTAYRLLEPIRAVALDALVRRGGLDQARDDLAAHLAARASDRLERSRTRLASDAAAAAMEGYDQIHVAFRHCVVHDHAPERSRVLYAVLWGVVQQARLDEVCALGEQLVARWPDASGRHGADAASVLATARLLRGDIGGARSLALDALAHEDESTFAAVTLRRALGHAARFEGDHAEAARWLAEAAEAGFASGVPTLAIGSLAYQAQDVAASGRADEAVALVRRAAALAIDLDSPLTLLFVRTVEASLLAGLGLAERAGAISLARANLESAGESNYPVAALGNLQTIVVCHLADGRLVDAARDAGALLDAVSRAGPGDLRRVLDVIGAVLVAAGDDEARHLIATAATLPDTSPTILGVAPYGGANGVVLDCAAAIRLARHRLALVVAGGPSVTVAGGADAVFARDGDVWRISYAGVTASVSPSKGIDDLALLLGQPGREIHCVELVGAAIDQPDTGEVIDPTARRRYEDRIRELQVDIDEAERDNDRARAERAQVEFDVLVAHLASALGLAGKSRRAGGTAERARSAVTHRIRSAVRRIAAVNPQLGRHLEASIATGSYCCYRPEEPVRWLLDSGQ